MTTKLRSKADYHCRDLAYNKGQEFEADPDLASFLLRDAPENFEIVSGEEPPAPAIRDAGQGKPVGKAAEAQKDRMVRSPAKSK